MMALVASATRLCDADQGMKRNAVRLRGNVRSAGLRIWEIDHMISVVIRQSLVQLQTPDHMRGRVSAVNSLFIGTSNQLGEFESGVTAAWFGVVPSVVIGGIGTLVVVFVWMRLFPSLANIDRLEGRAIVTEVAPRASPKVD